MTMTHARESFAGSHGSIACRFFMNWPGQQQGEGFEYHLLVIGMSAALLIAGGGKRSADRMVAEQLGD